MKQLVTSLVIILVFSILVGCKKDKGSQNNPTNPTNPVNQPKNIVFLDSTTNRLEVRLSIITTPQAVSTRIIIQGGQPATSNVTVTLAPVNNILSDPSYNLTELPSANYTSPTLTLTIPQGSSFVDFNITIPTTAGLDINTNYGLAYKIASVSGGDYKPATNLSPKVFSFSLKNKYDGRYRMHGVSTTYNTANPGLNLYYDANNPTGFKDAYNAAYTYYGDQTYSVITTGTNTDAILNESLNGGDYGYLFSNGGAGSYYATFAVELVWNTATDKLSSAVNHYGQPSTNVRSAELDPAGKNQFNTFDHSIHITYWMNQPTVISPHRAFFNEHWSYLGPR